MISFEIGKMMNSAINFFSKLGLYELRIEAGRISLGLSKASSSGYR